MTSTVRVRRHDDVKIALAHFFPDRDLDFTHVTFPDQTATCDQIVSAAHRFCERHNLPIEILENQPKTHGLYEVLIIVVHPQDFRRFTQLLTESIYEDIHRVVLDSFLEGYTDHS